MSQISCLGVLFEKVYFSNLVERGEHELAASGISHTDSSRGRAVCSGTAAENGPAQAFSQERASSCRGGNPHRDHLHSEGDFPGLFLQRERQRRDGLLLLPLRRARRAQPSPGRPRQREHGSADGKRDGQLPGGPVGGIPQPQQLCPSDVQQAAAGIPQPPCGGQKNALPIHRRTEVRVVFGKISRPGRGHRRQIHRLFPGRHPGDSLPGQKGPWRHEGCLLYTSWT